jgi:hypothetical protein
MAEWLTRQVMSPEPRVRTTFGSGALPAISLAVRAVVNHFVWFVISNNDPMGHKNTKWATVGVL